MSEKKLSQEDWLRRYRDRIMARTDLGYKAANLIAAASSFEDISDGYEDDPEGSADEELLH